MIQSLGQQRSEFSDRKAREMLSSGRLCDDLVLFTPFGAPAGDIAVPYGVGGLCPIPLVAVDGGLFHLAGDPLADRLRTQELGLGDDVASHLRDLIASDQLRLDGRPIFISVNGPRRQSISAWSYGAKIKTKDIRAVVLAAATDLEALPLIPDDDATVGPDGQMIDMSAAWMVGLGEHRKRRTPVDADPRAYTFALNADKAYKNRARGREVLAAVGAWPWCHFETGKLPRKWKEDQEVRDALASWIDECVTMIDSMVRRAGMSLPAEFL